MIKSLLSGYINSDEIVTQYLVSGRLLYMNGAYTKLFSKKPLDLILDEVAGAHFHFTKTIAFHSDSFLQMKVVERQTRISNV